MLFKSLATGLIVMAATIPNTAKNKKLPPCPNTPNCVSSQAQSSDSHFVTPFKIIADVDKAWQEMKLALLGQARTAITQETDDTLAAEATSLIFRFVDDIQVILDRENKLMHIRSASRIGYGDFGVNRKRVENLRSRLKQGGFIE